MAATHGGDEKPARLRPRNRDKEKWSSIVSNCMIDCVQFDRVASLRNRFFPVAYFSAGADNPKTAMISGWQRNRCNDRLNLLVISRNGQPNIRFGARCRLHAADR
jgi:hypothetical protein